MLLLIHLTSPDTFYNLELHIQLSQLLFPVDQ